MIVPVALAARGSVHGSEDKAAARQYKLPNGRPGETQRWPPLRYTPRLTGREATVGIDPACSAADLAGAARRPRARRVWAQLVTRDRGWCLKLSVVIPVCNEADNVAPLAREIQVALAAHRPFEIIFVDDGSTDGTAAAVCAAREAGIAEIRLLQHSRRSGQSAAVWTGVRAARADWVATLVGDGQNDPVDIPVLLEALATAQDETLRLIMGNRKTRRDSWLRRLS